MITNLDDDDNGNHFDITYKPTDLSLIDKMMLNKFKAVLADMKKGYDTYNFASVTDSINNFFVNDLSSFYLDFKKDTLYCEAKDSTARRNTQYVLYTIIKSLAIAYSPILAFTCEEIYRAIDVENRKNSVALEDYPDLGEVDAELLEQYKKFLELRDHVNAIIEPYRKDGVIGSSSEASVTYLPQSKEEDTVLRLFKEEEVAKILQVSHFALGDENKVFKHEGIKCDRCWNYFDDCIEDEDGNHLCARCHEVVSSLPKETEN
jgi:isoleucyl-tRNA synthetase